MRSQPNNASTTPVSSAPAREFPFSEKEFRLLAELAYTHTGIVLADHKKDMVYSRLVRRLRALRLHSFAEYCALVQHADGADELGNMVNALTTNLTSFFREAHHFEHLHDTVVKPRAQEKNGRLRIWSAGCSAGMEPYSIAMVLQHVLADSSPLDARILATDIDTTMLQTAREGEYASEQLRNIPNEYHTMVSRSADGTRIQMDPRLKQRITFNPLNLLHRWPLKGPFDAIFCRNVVIYFDKPTQADLFNRMADLLVPGGWLYIGHSENLFKVCDRFRLLGRTIYQRVR